MSTTDRLRRGGDACDRIPASWLGTWKPDNWRCAHVTREAAARQPHTFRRSSHHRIWASEKGELPGIEQVLFHRREDMGRQVGECPTENEHQTYYYVRTYCLLSGTSYLDRYDSPQTHECQKRVNITKVELLGGARTRVTRGVFPQMVCLAAPCEDGPGRERCLQELAAFA